jgi:hypothetical protein
MNQRSILLFSLPSLFFRFSLPSTLSLCTIDISHHRLLSEYVSQVLQAQDDQNQNERKIQVSFLVKFKDANSQNESFSLVHQPLSLNPPENASHIYALQPSLSDVNWNSSFKIDYLHTFMSRTFRV